MAESVYKFVELVGVSDESWEKAAAAAVERAAGELHGLRIAEVQQLDMTIEHGRVRHYRAKIKLSFKYEESMGESHGLTTEDEYVISLAGGVGD
jgi:flavin-binding protein dodecin